MDKFHEEKNRHATSFLNNNQDSASSTNKNKPVRKEFLEQNLFLEEKKSIY